jgi:hypothetical protein
MFATLKEISIAKYTNSQVQIPLNLNLYFGLSLPAFVTLHIVEHILPIGKPRMAVQGLKVFTGIPVLRKMQIPLANTDMRGTMI